MFAGTGVNSTTAVYAQLRRLPRKSERFAIEYALGHMHVSLLNWLKKNRFQAI
jgi:hypothetical protein